MKSETRWALYVASVGLLGRYCWDDASELEMPTRTFPTREAARKAKRRLSSYRDYARVVKVRVTVERVCGERLE